MDLSVVIPCLNEENTIGICVDKCLKIFNDLKIEAEIIVVDNSSSDSSVKVAESAGAKVIHNNEKGYGATIRKGFEQAQGEFVLMADGDNSYDFLQVADFWNARTSDFDMIIGSRFRGKIEKGAMPNLHRYFGTPFLTFMLNFLFSLNISDSQSGMRFFRKKSLDKIKLETKGMEFASELSVKFKLNNMKISEIPINLYKDGRNSNNSNLRPWRDGFRHLFYMLKMRFFYKKINDD